MLDFEKFVARHGEFAVQAIIEGLERHEGIYINRDIPLEDRWNALMQSVPTQHRMAA